MPGFIFDMDGVIIDSEPLHFQVESQLCQQFGIKLSEGELESYVGTRAEDMWSQLKETHRADFNVIEVLEAADKAKMRALKDDGHEPIPGIRELLHSLKEKGYQVGLASSSPRPFIEAVLDALQIQPYFDVVISGEEVEKGKPAPDIYLDAAKKMGSLPDNCTVLEDAAHGVQAGKAAGMKVIGYINPNSGEQNLSEADALIQSIHQLRITADQVLID
ncbi:HAD family hydrolase [Shouchella patagoniensis]|uniref:HAD family hydrolase n=1 Tax=Shouchella patagoniensis TaxID=228576 RepID=UPI000995D898|nr:HAD family phosphatase [Shouchella patagoniensis]